MLQHFGITPYVVFDGDYLPSKAATEDARRASREKKKQLAKELLEAGKRSAAAQEYQKCIDVTPEMAAAWIYQLKKQNISYVVAPYEADAQLVYLERKGLADGILSDDSDLLVFGAKRLLTKLDQYGNCIEINRRDFCACREVSLTGWTDEDFRRMCIMSGCDYHNGLPNVGLKTAHRMLRKSKTPERVVRMLQLQGKIISENFLKEFYQAELTFLHQWVFCPEKQELVNLTDLPGDRTADEMPYVGSWVNSELARSIARGDVNPITKVPINLPLTPSKRRHSQMNSIPTSKNSPIKPIKSYFKNNGRIPMGAMEPNCFKVDADRVAQLTDGGAVPRVFPLPRPYLKETTHPSRIRTSPRINRRRTEPINNMLSRMDGSTASSSSPAGKATPSKAESSTRPPKKARLCDDTKEEDHSPKQSKFFSAMKPARRAKSDAHLLMSDDSLNEAMLDLIDTDGFESIGHKKTKSISIFQEEEEPIRNQGLAGGAEEGESGTPVDQPSLEPTQEHSQTTTEETSQETASTSITEPTFSFSPDDTGLAHHKLDMPPPSSTTRQPLSTTPSRSNLNRFSYTSSYSSTTTPASSSTTYSSRSSIFSAADTPSTGPSTAASSRPTPLQRIGAKALNAPSSPKPRQSKFFQPKRFSGVPVNPSFVPLPKVDMAEVEALNTVGGSEDQIIPDSDGENEEPDLEDKPPTRLNLTQFAFNSAGV